MRSLQKGKIKWVTYRVYDSWTGHVASYLQFGPICYSIRWPSCPQTVRYAGLDTVMRVLIHASTGLWHHSTQNNGGAFVSNFGWPQTHPTGLYWIQYMSRDVSDWSRTTFRIHWIEHSRRRQNRSLGHNLHSFSRHGLLFVDISLYHIRWGHRLTVLWETLLICHFIINIHQFSVNFVVSEITF
jgi:hypothetical protein